VPCRRQSPSPYAPAGPSIGTVAGRPIPRRDPVVHVRGSTGLRRAPCPGEAPRWDHPADLRRRYRVHRINIMFPRHRGIERCQPTRTAGAVENSAPENPSSPFRDRRCPTPKIEHSSVSVASNGSLSGKEKCCCASPAKPPLRRARHAPAAGRPIPAAGRHPRCI